MAMGRRSMGRRSMGRRSMGAALAAAALLAGCAGAQKDEPTGTTVVTETTEGVQTATLRIASPAPGTIVKGNVVTLDFEAKGISIVKADGDTSGETGHYHVFIDRDPVAPGETIPKEAGIVHATDDPLVLSGLSVGPHRLTAVYGDGAHTRLGRAVAETTVDVKGPSVDATVPATAVAGSPVKVEVKVEGLPLVKADGDTSGTTGHLHVLVDRAPVAGQPIPVDPATIVHSASPSMDVPGLATGEHTLWVVAGNGAHVPLDPMVMDKVVVNVTAS